MYTGLYTPFHPKCVGYLHFLSLLFFSFLITNSTITSVKMIARKSTKTVIKTVNREKDKYELLYNLSYTKSYIPDIIITTVSELESWETDGSTGRETWGTADSESKRKKENC